MSVHTPIAVCCSCRTEHFRLCHATASVVHIASREAMSLAKFGIEVNATLSVNADDGPRDCMSDEIATPTKKRHVAGSPASPPSSIKGDGQVIRSGGDYNAPSAPDMSGTPPATRPTCQAHYTEPADDPDTPCLGVRYRGVFFNFVDYDGKPLSSIDEPGELMFVTLGYDMFRAATRRGRGVVKKRPPRAVAARVPTWRDTHTFGAIMHAINANYGKHTRRQWKVNNQSATGDATYEVQVDGNQFLVTPSLTPVRMVYTHDSFVRVIQSIERDVTEGRVATRLEDFEPFSPEEKVLMADHGIRLRNSKRVLVCSGLPDKDQVPIKFNKQRRKVYSTEKFQVYVRVKYQKALQTAINRTTATPDTDSLSDGGSESCGSHAESPYVDSCGDD